MGPAAAPLAANADSEGITESGDVGAMSQPTQRKRGVRFFKKLLKAPHPKVNWKLVPLLNGIAHPLQEGAVEQITLALRHIGDEQAQGRFMLLLMDVCLGSILERLSRKGEKGRRIADFKALALSTWDTHLTLDNLRKRFEYSQQQIGDKLIDPVEDQLIDVGLFLLSIALPDQQEFTTGAALACGEAAKTCWRQASGEVDKVLGAEGTETQEAKATTHDESNPPFPETFAARKAVLQAIRTKVDGLGGLDRKCARRMLEAAAQVIEKMLSFPGLHLQASHMTPTGFLKVYKLALGQLMFTFFAPDRAARISTSALVTRLTDENQVETSDLWCEFERTLEEGSEGDDIRFLAGKIAARRILRILGGSENTADVASLCFVGPWEAAFDDLKAEFS